MDKRKLLTHSVTAKDVHDLETRPFKRRKLEALVMEHIHYCD